MRGGWAPAWRLARGLALSANPRQRWRQVSIVFSAAVATVALLVTAMMAAHLLVVDDHLDARRPNVGGTAVADWGKSMPILPEGLGQIPIQWISPDPGHENDPSLVPPGLDRLPAPGKAVISPGLARHGLTAEDLGLRPSDAGTGEGGTIGDDFLISRSEGYAIARPPEGQKLDQDFVKRISGYGPGEARVGYVETTLDVPAGVPGAVSVLALVFLPALLLLGTAARAVGGVTRERAERLWRLGVSAASIRRVVTLETGVLALLGAVSGALVWLLILSWRTSWPGNDAVLLPAARGSWWMPAVVIPLTVGVAVLWATTARVVPQVRRSGVRWGDWAILPLIAAFVCLGLAVPLPELLGQKNADLSMQLLMVGAVLVIVGLPWGFPCSLDGCPGCSPAPATPLAGSPPSVWAVARYGWPARVPSWGSWCSSSARRSLSMKERAVARRSRSQAARRRSGRPTGLMRPRGSSARSRRGPSRPVGGWSRTARAPAGPWCSVTVPPPRTSSARRCRPSSAARWGRTALAPLPGSARF